MALDSAGGAPLWLRSPSLASLDGGSSDGGAEALALRQRVRGLQALVQEREIGVVAAQKAGEEWRERCHKVEAELASLRGLQSNASLEYLKNVCTRFMASDDDSLVPVLCTLMGVDAAQQRTIGEQRKKSRHSRQTAERGGAGAAGGSGGGGGSGGSGFLASFYGF